MSEEEAVFAADGGDARGRISRTLSQSRFSTETGSDQSGRVQATLARFTATCELFRLNPWLRDTLTRLLLTPAERLSELLPTSPPAPPQ